MINRVNQSHKTNSLLLDALLSVPASITNNLKNGAASLTAKKVMSVAIYILAAATAIVVGAIAMHHMFKNLRTTSNPDAFQKLDKTLDTASQNVKEMKHIVDAQTVILGKAGEQTETILEKNQEILNQADLAIKEMPETVPKAATENLNKIVKSAKEQQQQIVEIKGNIQSAQINNEKLNKVNKNLEFDVAQAKKEANSANASATTEYIRGVAAAIVGTVVAGPMGGAVAGAIINPVVNNILNAVKEKRKPLTLQQQFFLIGYSKYKEGAKVSENVQNIYDSFDRKVNAKPEKTVNDPSSVNDPPSVSGEMHGL